MALEERSCLEGVYTVRRSVREAAEVSEKKLGQLRVCSLFRLGPVTSEELEEEVAYEHVCVH